jgi:probable HAF family extracellular repeat protein
MAKRVWSRIVLGTLILVTILVTILVASMAGAQVSVVHGFLWTASGGMQDLGAPSGWIQSSANAISKSGQIAGSLTNSTNEFAAAVWTPQTGWHPLSNRLNPKYSTANGINSARQVVGVTNTSDTITQHAFFWSASTGMLDIGTLGGSTSTAYGINDAGEVVGGSVTATGAYHAFLWTQSGGMQDLGTLNEGSNPSSVAYAINDKGIVAGASTAKDGYYQAVFWKQDQIHVLKGIGPPAPVQESGPSSDALGINNVGTIGEIVGSYSISAIKQPAYPFLWSQAGGLVNLGLVDGSTNNTATGIHDSGQVVGYGILPDGTENAFIWTAADGLQDLGSIGGTETVANAINNAGQVIGAASTP